MSRKRIFAIPSAMAETRTIVVFDSDNEEYEIQSFQMGRRIAVGFAYDRADAIGTARAEYATMKANILAHAKALTQD